MIRGDIWWVDLGIPLGSEPGYRRPVLIIQENAFNKSLINTVIVIPFTTNLSLADAPGNVQLSKKDTKLSKESVAIVSQIVSLDKFRFIEKAGKIEIKKLKEIEDGIKLVLSL